MAPTENVLKIITLVVVARIGTARADTCVLPEGGQCNPDLYKLSNPLRVKCYCDTIKPTWGWGYWLGPQCKQSAESSSAQCECSVQCEGLACPRCRCVPEFENSHNVRVCYKGIKSCAGCSAGYQRKDCGCYADEGGTHRCGAGSCEECPAGKYSVDGVGPCADCSSCPAGEMKVIREPCSSSADTVFIDCPDGRLCPVGECPLLGASPLCPVNSFCRAGIETPCFEGMGEQCPNAGMTAFERWCRAGKAYDAFMGTCVVCDAGKYKSAIGTSSLPTRCSVCLNGTFARDSGAALCAECPPGHYMSMEGATACLACLPGTYQPSSRATACLRCPSGTYATERGRGEPGCLSCGAGTFQDAAEKTACLVCEMGTYSLGRASSCTDCGAGLLSDRGAKSANACYACPAGKWASRTAGCEDCPGLEWFYCPGDGMKYPRRMAHQGQTYWSNYAEATADARLDYVVTPCSVCLPPPAQFISSVCTISSNTRCRACSKPVALFQYTITPCQAQQDAVFGDCSRSNVEDMIPGGRCNPCPPGTRNKDSAEGKGCELCPSDTFKASYGDGACTPCPAGTLSGGGASRCTIQCGANANNNNGNAVLTPSPMYAYDGARCATIMSAGGEDQGDKVPWRVVASGKGTYVRAIALSAQLADGTKHLAVQNLGRGGALIWLMGASPSPSAPDGAVFSNTLLMGDASFSATAIASSLTTTAAAAAMMDGEGGASRFGIITAFARGPDMRDSDNTQTFLLAEEPTPQLRLRIILYTPRTGAAWVKTLPYLVVPPPSAASAPSVWGEALLSLRMKRIMGLVGMDVSGAVFFLAADIGAHCIWRISPPSSAATGTAWTSFIWRGGQAVTGDPIPPRTLADTPLSAGGGNEYRLAAPTAIGVLVNNDNLIRALLTIADPADRVSALGFVLDARGVWAFDAADRLPAQSLSDLTYVCGGGATKWPSSSSASISCLEWDMQKSGVNGMTVGTTSGGAALFFTYSDALDGGVVVCGLQRTPATMTVRLLGKAGGNLGTQRPSGGLSTGRNGFRLFVAQGGGSEGRIVELASDVLGTDFLGIPSPANSTAAGKGMSCICRAGLFCDPLRRQCVPAPAGRYAPEWSARTFPCPIGTYSVFGPEARTEEDCQPCPYPTIFTAYVEGSYACQPRCEGNQIYSSAAGRCIPGCDANNGEYEQPRRSDGTGGACLRCPAGTGSTNMGMGVRYGCAPCAVGFYGAYPGLCAQCPLDTTTFFKGTTLCSPISLVSLVPAVYCSDDGYFKLHRLWNTGSAADANNAPLALELPERDMLSEASACRSTPPRALEWRPANESANNASSSFPPQQRTAYLIHSLTATSDGLLFGGASAFQMSAVHSSSTAAAVADGTVAFTVTYANPGTLNRLSGPTTAALPRFQIVETMNEGRVLFAAERGGTCVWFVNRTGSADKLMEMGRDDTDGNGYYEYEDFRVWAGMCGTPGDMNGASASGIARLGYIFGMALVHVENFTPVLLVSTHMNGCASVRSISLYDASISTFLGADPSRLPSILLPQCAVSPYLIAVARGTDEVLYARFGDNRIWRAHALRPTGGVGSVAIPDITLSASKRLVGMCARGLMDGDGVQAFMTSDGMLQIHTSLFGGLQDVSDAPVVAPIDIPPAYYAYSSSLSSLLQQEVRQGGVDDQGRSLISITATAVPLACAGKRVWWAAPAGGVDGTAWRGDTTLFSAGIGHLVRNRGCMGGFIGAAMLVGAAQQQGDDDLSAPFFTCAQVGVGQYTTIAVSLADDGIGVLATESIGECKPGTYGRRAGGVSHLDCLVCPLGLVSPQGAAGCDACPGDRPYPQGGDCVAGCVAGYYLSGGLTCLECPPGTTAPVGARSSAECTACPAGKYSARDAGDQGCVACPAGTTSLAGSFRCVKICAAGTCAKDGETCSPITSDWDIMTTVFVQGGGAMRAVAVGGGGHVFYTDGETLMYVFDSCPIQATFLDQASGGGDGKNASAAGGDGSCYLDARNLLAAMAAAPSSTTARSFSALALAGGTIPMTPSRRVAESVRFLYVASSWTHSVYRFPLLYAADDSGLVDTERTARLWAGLTERMDEFTRAVYDAYYYRGQYEQPPSSVFPDGTGCDAWRLIGHAGARGSGQGSFFSAPPAPPKALLNMPVELELTPGDDRLLIVDYLNQRVVLADLGGRTVRTILGTGFACWYFGSANPAVCADTRTPCGVPPPSSPTVSCASVSRPLGIGLAPGGGTLYMAANTHNSVVALSNPLDAEPGQLAPYCFMDYDTNTQDMGHESCYTGSCMLHRPFDVLATDDGMLYVSVTNGITIVNTRTRSCRQVAGDWWNTKASLSAGLVDGPIDEATQEPISRFSQPFRLGVDSTRGIMYIADYDKGALRRVFIDGKCRCAEGSIFLPSASACFDPTPDWDAGQLLAVCVEGYFVQRVDGKAVCRPCTEASSVGIAAVACLLSAARQRARERYVSMSSLSGSAAGLRAGVSYAQVLNVPEPLGAIPTDWYYYSGGGTGVPSTPSWSDIFRPDSTVRYRLGRTAGRAPWGGEYVTLTFDPALRRWGLEPRTPLQPVRMLPGFWYPCYKSVILSDGSAGQTCECSPVPAAFANVNGTEGGLVRWEEVRRAAYLYGGRILGGRRAVLADFAGGNASNPAGKPPASSAVFLWSRFMMFGRDAPQAEMCPWNTNNNNGPCFPVFRHYQQAQTANLRLLEQLPNAILSSPPDGTPWTSGIDLVCATGWPAHYRCPSGYVWVGPNTSALADGQLLPGVSFLARGQIACLSCLPGSFSVMREMSSAPADGGGATTSLYLMEDGNSRYGGPYTCQPCQPGEYSAAVASTACTLCPSMTFSSAMGSTACTACPDNHYTGLGATDESMCSPCAPGTGSCTYCVAGQYQDQAAQYACYPCPPGTFSNSTNQSACEACPMGKYQDRSGQARCKTCSPRYYVPPNLGSGAGGAVACVPCRTSTCPLVIGGVCGRGCGLNYFWDEQAFLAKALSDAAGLVDDDGPGAPATNTMQISISSPGESNPPDANGCIRCPGGTINAYMTCASSPIACLSFDAPGRYIATRRWADGVGDIIALCPPGTGPNAMLEACVPCARGLYAVTGSGCIPCTGGTFAGSTGSTACALCDAGSFTPPFSDGGRFCLSPSYIMWGRCNAEGRDACLPCPKGTFTGVRGANWCSPCLAGSYASAEGATACTLCEAGKYDLLPGSSSPCSGDCPAGLGFYSASGATACVYCQGGVVLANGSLCVGCGLGRYETASEAESGGRICVDCPFGLVQLLTAFATGIASCVPCPQPSIHYAPRALKGRHCVRADPGFVANRLPELDGGAYDQIPCLAGTFRANASLECVPCPAGFASEMGSAACTPCLRGMYRSAAMPGDQCLPCPRGYIANETAATRCILCPAGTLSTDENTRCAPCPINTYSPIDTSGGGSPVCLPCPNDWVSAPGASACAPCPPWTTFSASAMACSVCPAGTFMRAMVMESGDSSPAITFACTQCAQGTHNARANATSARACIPCAVPAYVPNALRGATLCVPCPPGQASTDGRTCLPCRRGNFSAQGLSCARCAPGTYTAADASTQCYACPFGSFGDAPSASACTPCAAGTYNNFTQGATACARCPLDEFSNRTGATRCTARTVRCAEGSYVARQLDKPTEDNRCAPCAPCADDEYTVSLMADQWTSLTFFSAMGTATADAALPHACPGDTHTPGYRCIKNTWPAGQYITPSSLSAGLLQGNDGSRSVAAYACTDLVAFPPGIDGDIINAARRLMDYTVGPTFECYIGCKYGLNENNARSYILSNPDARGGLEAPLRNIFYPSIAKLYARFLCSACSTAPCTRAGRYRPVVDAEARCGPACLLYPNLCWEKLAGDGSSYFNDGCIEPCAPPPANATTVGGSAALGDRRCPWICNGPVVSARISGYHLRDDGTGCISCDDTGICDATHVHVPPSMCFPYSRSADVCKPCPPIEGGTPRAWLTASTSDANGTAQQQEGRCAYTCAWGYYRVDDEGTGCLPCHFLNNITCPVGMYRDAATCRRTGLPPECVPCSMPSDMRTAAGLARLTFRTPGIPANEDRCLGLCNAGFHTVLRSSMGAPGGLTYVSDDGRDPVSVHDLACVACTFQDSVPCHGACPPNFFRDRNVVLDTTPGACRRCTVNADCGVGEYAPLCLGNGSANVGCRRCDPSRLLQRASPDAPPVRARVFVPYAALNSLAAQNGLIRSDISDGRACPTACAINWVLDSADRVTCIPCETHIKNRGCQAEEARKGLHAPQQPKACDFRNAHWNASVGPMWWNAPQYTPSFLGGLRGSLVQSADNTAPGTLSFFRGGVCWACPTGLGTTAASKDLCELLPGFGLTAQGIVVERAPIPSLGDDLAIVLDEPRPSIPRQRAPSSLPAQQQALDRRRRRVLLSVSTDDFSNVSSALLLLGATNVSTTARRALLQNEGGDDMLLGPCLIGTYNTGADRICRACPRGTTTYARGSLGQHQCVCEYGYYNASQTMTGGCIPCPPDTYDARLSMSAALDALALQTGTTCLPCPQRSETTFGMSGQSACACRPGFMRQYIENNGDAPNSSSIPNKPCAPCLRDHFCTPCLQEQGEKCPNSKVWLTPCMPGGVAPPGSTSLLNCTCGSNQSRLLRGDSPAAIAALSVPGLDPPSNAAMYCLDPPPNSVYDAQLMRQTCKRGWTPMYHPTASTQQLRGCALCGRGRFARADPAVTSAPLQCLPCPIGNYTDRMDAIGGCTPCETGLTTQREGSVSALNCTCPPGMGRDRVTQTCTGCSIYEYRASDGKSCVRCPDPNMLTDATMLVTMNGADACMCGPGFARRRASLLVAGGGDGGPECTACPKGTFSAVASVSTACSRCPAGQTTIGVGGRSRSACVCDASQGFVQLSGGLCRNASLLHI